MEKFMNKELEKSVRDLKNYIENCPEYIKVLELKSKMEKSSNINTLIKEIKKTQKKYIRSGYDEKVGKELKNLEKKLNEILKEIPIYLEYNKNLKKINDKIFTVKEELNDYFEKKINI